MTRPPTKRIWAAVFLSAGLLTAASAVASDRDWRPPLKAAAGKVAGSAVRQARIARLWLAAHPQQAKTASAALLALAASLGVGLLLGRRIGRRPRKGHALPWRQVTELARRGQSVDSIARTTALPRDAVRALLVPVEVEPEFSRGKTFRKEAPESSEASR